MPRTSAGTSRHWVSLHVFHAGSHDLLLVDAVGLLIDFLTAQQALRGWFFLRYWEGGPHVRLRLLPAAGAVEVVQTAESRLSAFLAAHPSAARIPADKYVAVAARFARAEGRTEYDTVVRVEDRVERIAYRPEREFFGGESATHAAEDHFTTCSDIVLRVLRSGASRTERAATGVAVILAALALCDDDLDRLAGWLARRRDLWEPGGARGPAYEAVYQANRGTMRREIALVWAAAGAPGLPSVRATLLVDWRSSALRLQRTLRQSCPPERHRAHDAVPRVLLHCAHLACNRLGIAPDSERYLRYLAARAILDAARAGPRVAPPCRSTQMEGAPW